MQNKGFLFLFKNMFILFFIYSSVFLKTSNVFLFFSCKNSVNFLSKKRFFLIEACISHSKGWIFIVIFSYMNSSRFCFLKIKEWAIQTLTGTTNLRRSETGNNATAGIHCISRTQVICWEMFALKRYAVGKFFCPADKETWKDRAQEIEILKSQSSNRKR